MLNFLELARKGGIKMNNTIKSTLIKDTTKTERIRLIKQWEEEDGYEDNGLDLMEYFRDYIDGKKEIREINAEFQAEYVAEE